MNRLIVALLTIFMLGISSSEAAIYVSPLITEPDSSGNSRSGTPYSVTYMNDAERGGAYDFNGTTSYIDAGTDPIGTGPVTVCGWVKPRTLGEGSGGLIFDNGRFVFQVGSGPQLRVSRDYATYVASGNNITLGAWQFVAVTVDQFGTANFRINNAASGMANQNSGTPAAATRNLYIGNRPVGDRAFDGLIDDLRIYNRVLSVAEQDSLYQFGVCNDYAVGPELITNGDFSSWSGAADPNNTPTGWAKSGVGAASYVANNGGAARLVSDGTRLYISQPVTIGKTYIYSGNVLSIAGTAKFANSVQTIKKLALGINSGIYTSEGVTFNIQREAACDVTIDNVSIREVIPGSSLALRYTMDEPTIAESGNDLYPGTAPETPWATLRKVTTSDSAGAINREPIYLKRDCTHVGTLRIYKSAHSITSYGEGADAVVKGSLPATWTEVSANLYKASLGTAVQNDDVSLVFFSDVRGVAESDSSKLNQHGEWFWSDGGNILWVYSTANPDTSVEYAAYENGIWANWGANADSVTISDIEVKNFVFKGIYTGGGDNSHWDIVDCYVHDCGKYGTLDGRTNIFMSGKGHKIRRTESARAGGNCIEVAGDSCLVEECFVHDYYHHGIDSKGEWTYAGIAKGIVIRYNWVLDTLAMNNQSNGIYLGALNDSVLVQDAAVYGNVIRNAPANGILINSSKVSRIIVEHNDIVNSGANDLWIDIGDSSATVRYNIFYNRGGSTKRPLRISKSAGKTINGNCVWVTDAAAQFANIDTTAYSTWEDYQTAGYDSLGMLADPKFTNYLQKNHYLQSTSPCIDAAGTSVVGYVYTRDFNGTALPFNAGAFDIGAVEFVAHASSPVMRYRIPRSWLKSWEESWATSY